MKILTLLYSFIIIVLITGCKGKPAQDYLFTALTSKETGIDFSNQLTPTSEFNMLKYMYYYNGAGVGAGDFNNDGKIDLFFVSNQLPSRIYINEGNMVFKDVSSKAGINVNKGWNTGVSIVDINNDGMLDIYICRVSKFKMLTGENQLFVCQSINNGIPMYREEAKKYGLNFSGFSTQAAFLDFDLDGDLDMFLLNHSVNHDGNFAPRKNFIGTYDTLAGDQFYKNEGGYFTNITLQCGINSSKIGYGLGIAISDINLDGWPDIYVDNDFHENDYLYINQKNGTYREALNEHIMHTSQFSMGVDIADINNDAYPDIISMDMLPDDPQILKSSLGEDDYETSLNKLRIGYNHQYSRNNLQLNRRNGMFSEIAFYSGVSATDWSWSCLFMDFDNDGNKDLFISNGIPKRLNDIDYVSYLINDVVQQKIQTNTLDEKEMSVIYKFPEIKLPNRFYKNNGNAKFSDIRNLVENNTATFSNGALYADLDNDGDLDIVVNNINDAVLIYKNNNKNANQFADIKFTGSKLNPCATGTKLFLFSNNQILSFEKFGVKGFLSSAEIPLHVGAGKAMIDSALVVWSDNTFESFKWDTLKHSYNFIWKEGLPLFDYKIIQDFYFIQSRILKDITRQSGLNFLHEDNSFNEYNREPLILKILGNEGPALAVGDLNGDGLDDVFVGNAKWKKAAIFMQTKTGKFLKNDQAALLADSTYEDVDAEIQDVNNDGFYDLVIASGGNEFYGKEPWMQPRIYLNNSTGKFSKISNPFPGVYTTQSCISPCDFNKDGFIDFFIGSRAKPFAYGISVSSYLMQNDGTGHYKDVSAMLGNQSITDGFVTNAAWADVNNDQMFDLIITKEWGSIEVYINNTVGFQRKEIPTGKGWWNFILPFDADGDGDIDLFAGNQGENSRVNPSFEFPLKMYYNDFDENGTMEQVVTFHQHEKEIPLATKMDLERQLPYIKKKFLYAADFANATLPDLFNSNKLKTSKIFTANNFSNTILINDGTGNYTRKVLPWQAQLSCFRDAAVIDINGDELPDIIAGGNFYQQTMQLNRNDADFGTVLINQGKGVFSVEKLNGVVLKNEIRHIKPIKILGKSSFIIARNNDSVIVIQ